MSFTEILDELPKLKAEERCLLLQRLRALETQPRSITVAELARRWKPGAYLSPEEADDFARDIEDGRRFFKPYVSPWD